MKGAIQVTRAPKTRIQAPMSPLTLPILRQTLDQTNGRGPDRMTSRYSTTQLHV
jgi:hypothetical protein